MGLNAGYLSTRALSHIFGGETEMSAQAVYQHFRKFEYAPSKSMDVAY
jgi:hypothetical protein